MQHQFIKCMLKLSQIPASCESIQSGYLMLKSGGSGGGSKPVKRWFALLPDFVLYSFKSAESLEALTATPIPGHTVLGGATELRGDSLVTEKERDKVVKLFYQNSQPVQSNNNNSSNSPVPLPVAARKVYYLTGNSCQEMERYNACTKKSTICLFVCLFVLLAPCTNLFCLSIFITRLT